MKYKYGDKVIRTGQNIWQVVQGEIYTVLSCSHNDLQLIGIPELYAVENFELVEEKTDDNFKLDLI